MATTLSDAVHTGLAVSQAQRHNQESLRLQYALMGGTLVRTIGLARANAKIGMKNLAYNMRRLAQLRRLTPCPA